MSKEAVSKTNLSDIKFDKSNANKGSVRGRGMIEASMREFGFADAGTLDRNNTIIGGNKRTEVAGEISLSDEAIIIDVDGTKPVYIRRNDLDLSDPDDARARRLAYALNRTSEVSMTWDTEQLLADVNAGVDLSGMFRADELDELLAGMVDAAPVEDVEPQIDRAEELRQQWGVELGQLWQLGDHRLICGDCTDADVVARVMDGEKADMVFTDPPYGVDYDGGLNEKKRTKIVGDKTGDLYLPALKSLKSICKEGAPMYIWFADRDIKPVYDAVDAIGYTVRAMIVWNKLKAHYGDFMAQYMQKHEPCLYIVDGNASWTGPTNEVTVWDVDQPSVNEFHPTQKPLELAARAIRNHDAPIVADWFCGSGTTIIACEQLGRKCRAAEISPAYTAVALERYFQSTGREPVRVE